MQGTSRPLYNINGRHNSPSQLSLGRRHQTSAHKALEQRYENTYSFAGRREPSESDGLSRHPRRRLSALTEMLMRLVWITFSCSAVPTQNDLACRSKWGRSVTRGYHVHTERDFGSLLDIWSCLRLRDHGGRLERHEGGLRSISKDQIGRTHHFRGIFLRH